MPRVWKAQVTCASACLGGWAKGKAAIAQQGDRMRHAQKGWVRSGQRRWLAGREKAEALKKAYGFTYAWVRETLRFYGVVPG